MTKEEIAQINTKYQKTKLDYEQGIFVQPSMLDIKIKEPVLYKRWVTGGTKGGWYGFDEENGDTMESKDSDKEPNFDILDFVLQELKPNITHLQYKEVERLIRECDNSDYEYYGNSTEYSIKYILLSELEAYLKTF